MPTRVTSQESDGVFGRFQDIEVTGRVIGPQFSRIFSAIDALVAHNEVVTLGNSVLRGLDPIPAASELFDLSQPDCVSSLGRKPSAKEITYEPGHLYDEVGTEYDNALAKFAGRGTIGCFGATPNLVTDPEDLTTTAWTLVNCTAEASAKVFAGHPLTKLICASTSGAYIRQDAAVTTATPLVRAIVCKGNASAAADLTRVALYDFSASAVRGSIDIKWTDSTYTAGNGATDDRVDFYGDFAVVRFRAASVNTGNTNAVLIYPDLNEAATDYAYAGAVMVSDAAFLAPFTPTSRPVGSARYPLAPATKGTIDLWVRPLFSYDSTGDKYVWRLGGSGASGQISLSYHATNDKWVVRATLDGSNYRYVYSTSAFTANAALQVWQHIKVVWDLGNDAVSMYVDGVAQTDTAAAGSCAAFAFAGNYLYIGGLVSGYACNSLLCDFLYQPSVEDTSATHYTNAVPWYDTSEVTNKYQSVRINRYGIRLHNANIGIGDDYGRYIGISPAEGLLARDAAGKIIHDIPTAPILADMIYGGHLIWRDAADYFAADSIIYTSTAAAETTNLTGSVQNTALAAHLPPGMTNVKGVLCSAYLYMTIATAKGKVGADRTVTLRYGTAYGSVGSYNYAGGLRERMEVAGVSLHSINWLQALIPVVWYGGAPYVVWQMQGAASGMDTASGQVSNGVQLYLAGVLI
jgi:hypothetical protein